MHAKTVELAEHSFEQGLRPPATSHHWHRPRSKICNQPQNVACMARAGTPPTSDKWLLPEIGTDCSSLASAQPRALREKDSKWTGTNRFCFGLNWQSYFQSQYEGAEKNAFSRPSQEHLKASAEFSRTKTSAKSAGFLGPARWGSRRPKTGWRRGRDSNRQYACWVAGNQVAISNKREAAVRAPLRPNPVDHIREWMAGRLPKKSFEKPF